MEKEAKKVIFLKTEGQLLRDYPSFYFQNDKRIRFVLENIRNTGNLLDFGCGKGALLQQLPNTFNKYGIEPSKKLRTIASANSRGNYNIIEEQIDKIPFSDGFLKYIVCNEIFDYVLDIEYTLAELHRVLNRKGRLIIIEKNKNAFFKRNDSEFHKRRFKLKEFSHKLEGYFRKVNPQYLGIPVFSDLIGFVCKK